MTILQLISKIHRIHSIRELFGTSDWKRAYRQAVSRLHPDRCTYPGSVNALIRLNELRRRAERGQLLQDDAGELTAFDHAINFRGDYAGLVRSYENYQKLKQLRNAAAGHFHRFLPETYVLRSELRADYPARIAALNGRQFPLHHVNWILSRLLEFCAWLAQESYVHAGLHPGSIWLVPKTHGILIPSFYHLTRRGGRLKTISATYQHWYPANTFTEKRAHSAIDLEMAKRTAAYLLGDRSGSGVLLRRDLPGPVTDFLLAYHEDAYACYDEFRQLLRQHFTPKYYPLMS
ncbi:MAG: hypothetical protein AAGJ82_02770 [Bacteroidota bacterium]